VELRIPDLDVRGASAAEASAAIDTAAPAIPARRAGAAAR
jgi:hypothetical protein